MENFRHLHFLFTLHLKKISLKELFVNIYNIYSLTTGQYKVKIK